MKSKRLLALSLSVFLFIGGAGCESANGNKSDITGAVGEDGVSSQLSGEVSSTANNESYAAASTETVEKKAWERKEDMPTARYSLKAAVLDNQIYVIGGLADGKPLATVEVYDTEKETWSKKADLLSTGECMGAVAVNGKIYAFIEEDTEKTKGSVEEYDPSTDSWSVKSDMPSERRNTAFVPLNNKIYAVGGLIHVEKAEKGDNIANFRNLKTVDEYDLKTGKWTPGSILNTAVHALAVVESGGRLYSLGGSVTDENGSDGPAKIVQEYDPVADKWKDKGGLIFPMAYHTAAVLDGKVYITGGSALKNMVAAYDPKDGAWTNKKSRTIPSWQNCSVAVNGKIYVIGGTCDFNENPKPLNIMEVYDPELDR